MAKVNNTNTRTMSVDIINDVRCGVFFVNFEHTSYPFLVILLLTLNREIFSEIIFDIGLSERCACDFMELVFYISTFLLLGKAKLNFKL